MSSTYTVSQIASKVAGHVHGNASRIITGISSVEDATPSQITWLSRDGLLRKLPASKAGAVLIRRPWLAEVPEDSTAILVDRPSVAIIQVLSMFEELSAVSPDIHPTAVIAASALLGDNVSIGPHVVIGPDTQIGDNTVLQAGVFIGQATRIGHNCVIWPHVVIRERCIIGNRVIIHPNATIGADGFGYEFVDGRHVKIPHIGNVMLEDDVEIGANSCVDRAKFSSTRIGAGSKIDNQVQIAHNVQIGEGCLLVGQVAVAGSARIGPYCVLAGRVGVSDHTILGSQVVVASCSCVSGVIPDRAQLAGTYAFDVKDWRRSQIAVRRLPKMIEQMRELGQRVAKIEDPARNAQEG
jgi:UDP-3-O-[3-hydroxymyristoyl] glucosamine N-acyltransferase